MDLKRPLRDGRLLAVAIIVVWCIMAVFISVNNSSSNNTPGGVSARAAKISYDALTSDEHNLRAGASRATLICITTTESASISDLDTFTVSSSDSTREDTAEANKEQEPENLRQNEDVVLLAKLIQGEGGSVENIDERAAIALTVLYRTDSPKWPNSIYENVYKPYQYEAAPGPDAEYSEGSMQAAIKAYSCWKDGTCEEILPREYMSFFGYAGHNWFYKSDLEIYSFPGLGLPANIYEAMHQVIPALREQDSLSADIGTLLIVEQSKVEQLNSSDTQDVISNEQIVLPEEQTIPPVLPEEQTTLPVSPEEQTTPPTPLEEQMTPPVPPVTDLSMAAAAE